jgi:hypothetical protein
MQGCGETACGTDDPNAGLEKPAGDERGFLDQRAAQRPVLR